MSDLLIEINVEEVEVIPEKPIIVASQEITVYMPKSVSTNVIFNPNDFLIYNNIISLKSSIPTKTSNLINDGDGTNNNSPFATKYYVDENGGKIDIVKVNGVPLQILNKSVDITIPSVPTNTSQLINDGDGTSNFATENYVQTHSGKKALVFKNVLVDTLYASQTSPYPEYPWKIVINGLTGVDNSMQPVVMFRSVQAWSGNYCNTCDSATNSVIIYCKQPELNVRIDIVCYYTNSSPVTEYTYYTGSPLTIGISAINCVRLYDGSTYVNEPIANGETIYATDTIKMTGVASSSEYIPLPEGGKELLVSTVGADVYGISYISAAHIIWQSYTMTKGTGTGSNRCELSAITEPSILDWTENEEFKVQFVLDGSSVNLEFNSLPFSNESDGTVDIHGNVIPSITVFGSYTAKLYMYLFNGSNSRVILRFNSSVTGSISGDVLLKRKEIE